ncbi:MAG: hypothetical protein U0271_06970 [Polyangiaceae bacterium]
MPTENERAQSPQPALDVRFEHFKARERARERQGLITLLGVARWFLGLGALVLFVCVLAAPDLLKVVSGLVQYGINITLLLTTTVLASAVVELSRR